MATHHHGDTERRFIARRRTRRSGTSAASGRWITTVDHKRIGILYGATAFVFFLIGGLEALIIRLQLARPDNNCRERPRRTTQLFTMHGTTMIFLAIMPLSARCSSTT